MYFQKDQTKGLFGILALIVTAGCTQSPKVTSPEQEPRTSYTEEAEGRAISKAAAVEVRANNFIEIKFKRGSALLTDSSKASLDLVLLEAQRSGAKVQEVIVMSWSDQEFPSKNIQRLTRPNRELAERRNTAIRLYYNSIGRMSVDTYNMAIQPNALAKFFNSTDNKLKTSLVAAGLPTTADALQYPSKASHAVILIKIE